MTFSHWQRPHSFSVPDIATDVLILGGGYVGLSTAYWLSEMNPALRIAILERRQCGEGASGRNAGFLTKGSANFFKELNRKWGQEKAKAILTFAETSLQLVNHHILRSSPELKPEKTTSFTLLDRDPEVWREDFSPEEFGFLWRENEHLPEGLKASYSGGFEHQEAEYKINPIHLLQSLRKNLEARKIQIIENVSGFKLTPDGCVTEVHTIRCKQVILALNGYSPQFHSSFAGLISAKRAQMMAVEFEGELEARHLYYDPKHLVYWRKSGDNVLLIGGKRPLDVAGEVGDFDRLSTVIQDGLESYLKDVLGVRFRILHRWAGTMGFTTHELPIVQKVTAPLDCYVIAGFSGHGMGLGFHACQEMAALVTAQKTASFFERFHETKITL